MIGEDDLWKDVSSGGGKKWLDFRYILNIDLVRFVDLYLKYENERKYDLKCFFLRS